MILKCPNCGNTIGNGARFCRNCGSGVVVSDAAAGLAKKPPRKARKTGFKLFLISLAAIIVTGTALGYVAARQGIEIKNLLIANDFHWSKAPAPETERVKPATDLTDPEKETSPATTQPETQLTTAQPETQLTTAQPEPEATTISTTMPVQIEPHYYGSIASQLTIIDDKAHIWTDDALLDLGTNGARLSAASGYSIMIVATNDLFGLADHEFADKYYDRVFAENNEENTIINDGYLLLINLQDNTVYLSTYGKAAYLFYNELIYSILDEIIPLIKEGKYSEAILLLYNRTPY